MRVSVPARVSVPLPVPLSVPVRMPVPLSVPVSLSVRMSVPVSVPLPVAVSVLRGPARVGVPAGAGPCPSSRGSGAATMDG